MYWDIVKADELPEGIDYLIADMAINSGPNTAIRLLQRQLKVVKVDGIIGPKTLTAVKIQDPLVLSHKIYLARRDYYFTVANSRNNKKFLKGWFNRLHHLYNEILDILL